MLLINRMTGFGAFRRPVSGGGANNLAYVNGNYGYNSSTPNSTVDAFSLNCTTGNLLVVFVKHEGASTSLSISDTAGNTYTPLTYRSHSNGDLHGQIFYAKNITGNASNVIRVTCSASRSYIRIYAHQYSGADTSSPFDQENWGQGSGTSLSTSNITTTFANEVLVAGAGEYNIGNYTAGTNYTERLDLNGLTGGAAVGATEDRIVSATGTYNATMTVSTSDAWILLVASFKSS